MKRKKKPHALEATVTTSRRRRMFNWSLVALFVGGPSTGVVLLQQQNNRQQEVYQSQVVALQAAQQPFTLHVNVAEPPAAFAIISQRDTVITDSSSIWYSPDGRWMWDSQGIPLYVWTYRTRATSNPDSFIAVPHGNGVINFNAIEFDSLRWMEYSSANILAVTQFANVFLEETVTMRIAKDPADPSRIDFLILEGQGAIVTIYAKQCPGQLPTDPPKLIAVSAVGDTITLRDSYGNLGVGPGLASLGDDICALRARYDHEAASIVSWSPAEIVVRLERPINGAEWLFIDSIEWEGILGGFEVRE